jgi:two-component system sensor kinase FixL
LPQLPEICGCCSDTPAVRAIQSKTVMLSGAEPESERRIWIPRAWVPCAGGLLIAVIAAVDWYFGEGLSLGALYVLPILLLSEALSRFQLSFVVLLCVVLRHQFSPPTSLANGILGGAFALAAYGLIGLFASELVKKRRETLQHLREIEHQQALRIKAEEQLRLLAEGSPAAIFTLDENAAILSANKATRELLGLSSSDALVGMAVKDHLPVLAEALKLDAGGAAFRTVAQVQGKRQDGTPFLAQACFTTYKVGGDVPRLAAIAFDSTEDSREREEQSQHQMLESNRIIAGAVAHEVRNVCSAMAVLYSNLETVPGIAANRDYQAMGSLVSGLRNLACLELHGDDGMRGSSADVRDVLNQLRILIDAAWRDEDARLEWPDLAQPILAAADSFTLLQAFLNIVNNSLSAVSTASEKRLTVSITTLGKLVHVCFEDTGTGVSDPASLFQPFRTDTGNVGLGLYISRALLRRHGGDVRYEPSLAGARFIVEVPLHGVSIDVATANRRNPALAGG